MQAVLLVLSLVILAGLGLVAWLLWKVLQRRELTAEDLPKTVAPEALEATERRLTSHVSQQVTQQVSALELKDAQRAKDQRQELGDSLRKGFEAQARVIDENLREVRAKVEALGKMSTTFEKLNAGVQRFNTVLSNVKARGTWAEIQLNKLLNDLLVPEQYALNVKPNPRSNKIVEFAIALPGQEEGQTVWLPIDSKFPLEDYERLLSAITGPEANAEVVAACRRDLIERAKLFATQVKAYITPPHTTDFAILFVPSEGLYLELAQDPSLCEDFRGKHILLAGPQTLAALINALQVGFRTLQVQRSASKAMDLLTKVKTQVGDFIEHCDKVEKKLDEARDALVKARGRVAQVDRSLSTISLPEEETPHA